MGLFDFVQNILGGANGSISDVVGGLADIPGLDGIQEQVTGVTDTVTSVTEGATDAIAPVVETGQTAVEDVTQKLGL